MQNQGCSANKEMWERRSHIKQEGRLHQIVRINLAFAYKNFHTGSSCFIADLQCESACR